LSDALDAISDAQKLADAFAQLHGEAYAANKLAGLQMQRRFQNYLPKAQHYLWSNWEGLFLGQAPCERAADCVGGKRAGDCVAVWGSFTGEWLGRENIGQHSGYDLRTFGVALGADRKVTKNAFIGGAFGYDNAYQDFRSIQSHDQIDAFRLMFYGGVRNGNTFADGYVGYTKDYHKTRRDIDIVNEVVRSKYDDNMVSLGFDIGRKLSFGKDRIAPSIGVHYIHLATPSITETGGTAALHIASDRYNSLRMPLGVKWSRESVGFGGILLTSEARMFYIREFVDDVARARTSFDGVRSVSFLAEGGSQGRNSGRFGVGLNAQLSSRMSLRADYDYEVYDHTTANAFSTTLGVRW
jgi:outer membrane autotransporter protein